MKILVTGATGYIGRAVCERLLQAGHTAVGTARSAEAAAKLEAAGLSSLRADLEDPASLASAASGFDGVVHAAMAWSPETGRIDQAAVEAMLESLAGSGKPFLYTSGVWVMGNTGDRVAGEMFPLRPIAFVAWRPAVERLVLNAAGRKVRGIVIRPAMVYGRGGGTLGNLFREALKNGVVRLIGDGSNRWSFVHVNDLADLYVRALERSAAGELYLAAHGPAHRLRDLGDALSRAAGVGGRVEFVAADEARQQIGPMVDGLLLDQQIASTKAARLLGWTPSAEGVLQEIARMGAQSLAR